MDWYGISRSETAWTEFCRRRADDILRVARELVGEGHAPPVAVARSISWTLFGLMSTGCPTIVLNDLTRHLQTRREALIGDVASGDQA